MFNIIFKAEKDFNHIPNKLIRLHNDYNFANDAVAYGDFSKTNIFIGENNSGKSRFLRLLYAASYHVMSSGVFKDFCHQIKQLYRSKKFDCVQSNLYTFNDIYEKTNISTAQTYGVNYFFESLKTHAKIFKQSNRFYIPVLRGFKDYKKIINIKLKTFLDSTTSIQNKDSIHHYISLLNLETTGLEDFDIYREIIAQEYFNDKKTSLKNILTGGRLYQEIKSMLLGTESQRTLINNFQTFLHDKFFSEYSTVQLIPNEQEKVLYVKIGEEERPIYDWGDGTQQIIIIFYSLYIHKDEEDNVFFIEEPEMYLHPGILRKFIEVLNSEIFKNHQYFITSHSNIILDTSADSNIDMSIFKFKKVKKQQKEEIAEFMIEQCNNGDVSLLNELGVRNSSVFLSNCSIWVEGITDRLYIKHFIDLYEKKNLGKSKLRENLDFTFIEYGGGNLSHFNFDYTNSSDSINAQYINNRIFLVADNDNTTPSSAKGQRKERLKKVLGENFYELPVLEIENIITQETLKNVLMKQNPNKEKMICQKFSKEKNFAKKKLGKYIDDLFVGEIKKYAGESGTIKNKVEFCKTVIGEITDYDMLSDFAKDLTQKVYAFIENNN